MRIQWMRPIPGWLIFAVMVVLTLLSFFYSPDFRPHSDYEFETITRPAFESPLSESLPHYRYKQVEDSLKRVAYEQEYFSEKNGNEWQVGLLGVAEYGTQESKEYFVTVGGYRTKEGVEITNNLPATSVTFPVWDKTDGNSRSGHMETKTTGIKYMQGTDSWDGKVYVHISKTAGVISQYLIIAVLILAATASFYGLLLIPLRLLWQLSKGRAFTEENIGSLYITGWLLVLAAPVAATLQLIGHLAIRSQIPPEIEFSFYATLMKGRTFMLAGLAVLLLAKAFLQGLEMREEQELTV